MLLSLKVGDSFRMPGGMYCHRPGTVFTIIGEADPDLANPAQLREGMDSYYTVQTGKQRLLAYKFLDSYEEEHIMSVVYVVQLKDKSLYVGRTNLTREERIENHKRGHKSARVVKRIGILAQRDDLIPAKWAGELGYDESHKVEADLANRLRNLGYNVHGGH